VLSILNTLQGTGIYRQMGKETHLSMGYVSLWERKNVFFSSMPIRLLKSISQIGGFSKTLGPKVWKVPRFHVFHPIKLLEDLQPVGR